MKNVIARMVLVAVLVMAAQVVTRKVVTVLTERDNADGGAIDGPKAVRSTIMNFESIWQNHILT